MCSISFKAEKIGKIDGLTFNGIRTNKARKNGHEAVVTLGILRINSRHIASILKRIKTGTWRRRRKKKKKMTIDYWKSRTKEQYRVSFSVTFHRNTIRMKSRKNMTTVFIFLCKKRKRYRAFAIELQSIIRKSCLLWKLWCLLQENKCLKIGLIEEREKSCFLLFYVKNCLRTQIASGTLSVVIFFFNVLFLKIETTN